MPITPVFESSKLHPVCYSYITILTMIDDIFFPIRKNILIRGPLAVIQMTFLQNISSGSGKNI